MGEAARERAGTPDSSTGTLDSSIVLERNDEIVLSNGVTISANRLWRGAHLVRMFSGARSAFGACVVGSSSVVRRLWYQDGLRPRCLFVPDHIPVPEWCHHPTLPTVIVRGPMSEINDELTNCVNLDGFAAEFDIPPQLPLTELTAQQEQRNSPVLSMRRVVVVQGTSIRERTLGVTMKSAVLNGFDAMILIGDRDVYSEAIGRHSNGISLVPSRLPVYHLPADANSISMLHEMCALHRLFPFFMCRDMPDGVGAAEGTELVDDAAQTLAYTNWKAEKHEATSSLPPMGAMLFLPSEYEPGLGVPAWITSQWRLPSKALRLDTNDMCSTTQPITINPIAMHAFRKNSDSSHKERFKLGVLPRDTAGLDPVLVSASAQVESGPETNDNNRSSQHVPSGLSAYVESAHPDLNPDEPFFSSSGSGVSIMGDGSTDGDDEDAYVSALRQTEGDIDDFDDDDDDEFSIPPERDSPKMKIQPDRWEQGNLD